LDISWYCETCKTTRYRVESNLELPFQCDCGAIISSVTVDRLDAGPFITQAPSQYSLTNATNVTNNGVSNMHETRSDCKNEINGSHFHGGYNDRVGGPAGDMENKPGACPKCAKEPLTK